MTRKKILITGINGLIGKILSSPLSKDYDIFGIDIKPPFSENILDTDISNYQQIKETVTKFFPVDYLIHLAGDSRENAPWEDVLTHNIIGTRNIYEVARELKIKRVIFASSNHVTGAYEGFPPSLHLQDNPKKITIEDTINPDNDYGVSKAFGEALARYYYSKWGVESICLRIGRVKSDNTPQNKSRDMKMWLSHRDLIQLIQKSLITSQPFGIYYGVSNNKGKFWDISNAQAELDYNPLDDAFLVKQSYE